jgi:hypothetical protein
MRWQVRHSIEHLRSAKPSDDTFPILVHKRFVCHPMLESQTIPHRKTILTPMRMRRGPVRKAAPLTSRNSILPLRTARQCSHKNRWPCRVWQSGLVCDPQLCVCAVAT